LLNPPLSLGGERKPQSEGGGRTQGFKRNDLVIKKKTFGGERIEGGRAKGKGGGVRANKKKERKKKKEKKRKEKKKEKGRKTKRKKEKTTKKKKKKKRGA